MTENQTYNLQVANINPEPIGIFTLPSSKHLKYKESIKLINKQAPNELRQNFPTEKNTTHICNNCNQNIFKDFQTLSGLKEDIKRMILTYINTIGFLCENVVINDAWLNNAKKDSTLVFHYHANSYISGNYFVNYNPEIHSPLNFGNDRFGKNSPAIITPRNPKKKTIYNSNILGLNVTEGQILIWRSQMSHGYTVPNKGDDRLTLSFNSMPKSCISPHNRYSFDVVE